MSTFTLKIIALILMTIDHIGQFIPNMPIVLHWLGRLAAPIFLFCLLNGFQKTSSKKKYILRMYVFSIVVEVMNVIVNKLSTREMQLTNNIFAVYFSILLAIYLLDKSKEKTGNIKKGIKYIILWQAGATFLLLVADIFLPDRFSPQFLVGPLMGAIWGRGYESIFAIVGIVLYLCKENKRKFAIFYCIMSVLPSVFTVTSFWARVMVRLDYYTSTALSDICLEILGILISGFGFSTFQIYDFVLSDFLFYDYQWIMIFALLFAFLYNGKQGAKVKWLFYWYYPLHILVLFLLGGILTKG